MLVKLHLNMQCAVYILLCIVNAGIYFTAEIVIQYTFYCVVNAVNIQKYHSVYILLCIVNAGKTAEISFSIHFTVYSQCW